MVVVDSDSTDDTCGSPAEKEGAEVVPYAWDGRYPKKKQWCLDHVRTDIHVAALPRRRRGGRRPELLAELGPLFARAAVRPAAFDIPLGYWFAGRRLRHGYTIVKRALLDRTRCHFPEAGDLDAPGMGEQEGHYQPLAATWPPSGSPIEHE